MNNLSKCSIYLTSFFLGSIALNSCAQPEEAAPVINPVDPFAELSLADEWENMFRKAGELDPDDPFNNLTARQLWGRTWNGQWKTASSQGISFADFYNTIKGDSGDSYVIESPYPYTSAEEHWNAWMEAAGGGVQHTAESLPDWTGEWSGGDNPVMGGRAQLSDLHEATSDAYKAYHIQSIQAELEGRNWWPADTCLPNGVMRDGWRIRYIMMTPEMTVFIKDTPVTTNRYIFTDQRGFLPPTSALPQWEGESQGIWDGDELIIWTKNIRGWFVGHGQPENSDQLEIIERWKRIEDELVVDITLYDPVAFAYPWHDVAVFEKIDGTEEWASSPPTVNECVSTNNAYHDEHGLIAERSPTNPDYHDLFDLRPWVTNFERAERAKEEGLIPEAELFINLD